MTDLNIRFVHPLFRLSLVGLIFFSSCSSEGEEPAPVAPLQATDFTARIDENPGQGQVIGTISASSGSGPLSFQLSSQTPNGAFNLDATSGLLTVADESIFVFAENQTISGTATVSDGISETNVSINVAINDPTGPTFNIWTGARVTFSKSNGADPTQASNQDRITSNVWITRDNNGGQIYNAAVENSESKGSSPADTEWAQGTTANVQNLTFRPFRDAVGSPKGVVGKDLVLHLITDDVYIDIKFTSWSSGRDNGGGFAYERSSE